MTKFLARARRLILLSALVATGTLIVPTGTPAAVAGPNQGISMFCPCWGDVPQSEAAWDTAARNHAIIAGISREIFPRVERLHSVNPSLKLLVYNPGPYLNSSSPEYAATMREHPEYFARDKHGKLITVPKFPKLTLMDQGVAGWRELHTRLAVQLAAKSDGVYIDSLGAAPMGTGYTTGQPVKPSTKVAYTATEWIDLGRQVLNSIKAAVGSKYVMFNGLSDGGRYKKESAPLANSTADGGMSESFVRHATKPANYYPSATAFKDELDQMTSMASKGKAFFAWTKLWTGATEKERSDMGTFALATYLLGKSEKTYFNYLPNDSSDRTTIFYANQQANIGAPTGNYTVVNGVYSRNFANGKVTVDPARRRAVITLNRT